MAARKKAGDTDRPAEQQQVAALVPRESDIRLGMLRADGPEGLVRAASGVARTLAAVIRDRKLARNLGGKEYVQVEGWTTLATMLGVVPREVSIVEEDGGARYVATVELVRISDGTPLSRASAECGSDEKRWKNAPRYARRSMAITRATSKACRLAFSWVMALAGFQPTPAEEIVDVPVVNDPPPSRPEPQRDGKISREQAKALWAAAYEAGESVGLEKEDVQAVVAEVLEGHGIEKTRDIPEEAFDEFLETVRSRVIEAGGGIPEFHRDAPPEETGEACHAEPEPAADDETGVPADEESRGGTIM